MRTFKLSLLLLLGLVTGFSATSSSSSPRFEELLKIDIHAHIYDPVPEIVDFMRQNRLRAVNICTVGTIPDWLPMAERLVENGHRRFPDIFAFTSTFDLTHRDESDYHEQVKAWLDRSFEAGAVMTKIWKEVGMQVKKPDGSYLMPDDPLFDPIYDHLARRGKPLIAHLGEPIAAWRPLDPDDVHYRYYASHPQWHVYGRKDFPSHEQIIAARDHLLEKHPDLTVIGAHIGSLSHDVDEVALRLERYPNFYVEVGARTKNLSRQPREKVRNFIIRYQDRVLYGSDLGFDPKPEGYSPEDVQTFLKRAENQYRQDFRYYAGSEKLEMADREVEGLALPREVLEKFYSGNARRIIPTLGF